MSEQDRQRDESAFTRDLEAAASGNKDARDRIWAEHYDMLRSCANEWLEREWTRRGRERAISLGGSDIVHAAYLRLRDRVAALAKGRSWFFRCFYTECLRIAVDHYRKTRNDKGRGERMRVEFAPDVFEERRVHVDIQVVYEVLAELERVDVRLGQVAMLKVFESVADEEDPGTMRGLTNAEVAELLDYSLRTVEKDWAFAKSYILKRLGAPDS